MESPDNASRRIHGRCGDRARAGDGRAVQAEFLERGDGSDPRPAVGFLDAGVAHDGDLVDRVGHLGLGEFRLAAEHGRGAGAEPHGGDTVGMQAGHDIGPDAAAGMTPEHPWHLFNFRMAGRFRELGQTPKKRFFRTMPRIKPDFRTTGREVNGIVYHMVRRPEQRAIPLRCESLPLQVVGRRRALL